MAGTDSGHGRWSDRSCLVAGRVGVIAERATDPRTTAALEKSAKLIGHHPFLDPFDKHFRVGLQTLADHNFQDQTAIGVECDMIPLIATKPVLLLGGIAVLLFLGDEGPLLIQLHLAGIGGKKPRVRRGVSGRVRQTVWPGG